MWPTLICPNHNSTIQVYKMYNLYIASNRPLFNDGKIELNDLNKGSLASINFNEIKKWISSTTTEYSPFGLIIDRPAVKN